MLEIPSKKYPGVTFVLAAEAHFVSHLLALTLGAKKRMVHVGQKQVSSNDSIYSLCLSPEHILFGLNNKDCLVKRMALPE